MNDKFYYDFVNGYDHPYSWEEVLEKVQENPYATHPDEPFFFDEEGRSWTVSEIKAILDLL